MLPLNPASKRRILAASFTAAAGSTLALGPVEFHASNRALLIGICASALVTVAAAAVVVVEAVRAINARKPEDRP